MTENMNCCFYSTVAKLLVGLTGRPSNQIAGAVFEINTSIGQIKTWLFARWKGSGCSSSRGGHEGFNQKSGQSMK